MSQSHFQKFVPKKKNSIIKEEFKQAKKKAKKERAAAINKRFEDKRKAKFELRNQKMQDEKSKTQIANPKFQPRQPVNSNTKTSNIQQPTANVAQPANSMPLNKFLAHCGVCSRRDAVNIIKDGKVKVNNSVVLEPAFKVTEKDEVIYNNKTQ